MQRVAIGCVLVLRGLAIVETVRFFFVLASALQMRMWMGFGHHESTEPQNVRM